MMGPGWILAMTFLEPWGLLALAAPAILLVLGWSRDHSQESYLGTARFFEAEVRGDGGRRRRALPGWLILAAASLVLAALALARPGVAPVPPRGVVVELVVDRSPSMFLPVRVGGDPPEEVGRRIDVAFESFRAWAAAYEAREGMLVLVRASDGALTPWRDVDVPEPPRLAAAAPTWSAFDAPGVIWISDAEPADGKRVHAGVFSSGGAAVPGPISIGPAGAVVWKAPGVTEFHPELGSSRLLVMEPAVPALLQEVARLWAGERGLQVVEGHRGDVSREAELRILGPASEPTPGVAGSGAASLRPTGRDAWRAMVQRAPEPSSGSDGPGGGPAPAPWLIGAHGETLLAWSPGVIECYFWRFITPPDDEAAFAVSWVGLFDRARLAPAAVLAPAERGAAGSPVQAPPGELPVLLPQAEDSTDGQDPSGRRAALFRALLAGGSAVLGLLAFVLVSGVTDRRRARRQ